MPPDQDPNMDDLLKAYAEKRRQDSGPSPQVHPVTRQLLQAEVAKLRRSGPASVPPQPQWWAVLFSRRLILGVSLFALLALLSWLLFAPGAGFDSSTTLAKNESPEVPAASPAPVRQQSEQADQSKNPKALTASKQGVPPTRPLVSPKVRAPDGGRRDEGFRVGFADADGLAADSRAVETRARPVSRTPRSRPAATAPMPASAPAPVKKLKRDEAPVTWRFVQTSVAAPVVFRSSSQKEAKVVLASFGFEQSGQTVRLLDADGSVYAGRMLAAKTSATNATALVSTDRFESDSRTITSEGSLAESRSGLLLKRTYAVTGSGSSSWFRVTGTNLTLKKPVVFEGVVVAGGLAPTTPSLQLIQGTLQIGSNNTVWFDATPSKTEP